MGASFFYTYDTYAAVHATTGGVKGGAATATALTSSTASTVCNTGVIYGGSR
jgi:hypothetical protein